MRSSLLPVTLLAAALLTSCSGAPTGDDESRTFDFTYSTRIPAPEGTQKLEIWVPLASTDPGVQEVKHLNWTASKGSGEIRREKVFGNRMIHVVVRDPQPITEIVWRARVRRFGDTGQGSLPSHERYLAATSMIPLDGKARELAERLGVTASALDATTRAKRIYDDVLEEMAYDKSGVGWGLGSFEHATTICKGNCTDFHSRFLGVGRAAGIPVRFTMGVPMASGKTTYDSYHCWAHYRDGAHWRPVDISEADKVAQSDPEKAQWFFGNLDANRLSISFGRDVELAPPAATGPRNYFVFPHAEADGRVVAMKKGENWRFSWAYVE